jgi:hypothetical protein
LNKDFIKDIEERFAPEARAAAKEVYWYLRYGEFDGKAIAKLSKLKGFCKPLPIQSIQGTFNSASGFPTMINLGVIAEAPDKQALRVVLIRRKYPSAYTSAQLKDLNTQFKANYSSIRKSSFKGPSIGWSFIGRELALSYAAPSHQTRDLLEQYPGCGGAVSID